MHGDVEEEIEGTELAAEFTFSSLQKFGQEFLMKLRGKKMPNPLLKKVRIIFTHNKKKLNKVKKSQVCRPFFAMLGCKNESRFKCLKLIDCPDIAEKVKVEKI